MPKEEKTTTKITCDNEACPGTELKPNKSEGWFFVSAEVYGQPTNSAVFCSSSCASVVLATEPNILVPEQPPAPEQPNGA